MSEATKDTNPKDAIGVRKIPSACVSQLVNMEVGAAMLEGAAKYGRHNYREAGVRASVYYDGTRRHLDFWWEGQDIDPASGLNHITKAITSLYVLRDAMINEMWEDDRPPCHIDLEAFQADLENKVGAILDTHRPVPPTHYTRWNCIPVAEREKFKAFLTAESESSAQKFSTLVSDGSDRESFVTSMKRKFMQKFFKGEK